MSSKIKLGIIGGGGNSLIGVLHRVSAMMFDQFQIEGGVFSHKWEDSISFADSIGLSTNRVYKDINQLIKEEIKLPKDQRMQVVSILTPNYLHFNMAKKLLENGFHVICEKPLTTTYKEAKELMKVQQLSNKVFAVTYTYTGYPMVRQMKEMIANGEIGKIHKVDAQYYQGWINPIIHDKEKRDNTWRLDPEISGTSCCIGDIGTHAFDMIEYVTDLKVKFVLADLNYMHSDNKLDVDGTVLIRCSENVKGVICASQIATGEENNLTIQVYGEKGGFTWKQEDPNYLYLLQEGKPTQLLKPGHVYNSNLSLNGTKLPPGHPEGIFDAMGNIYNGVAKAIKNKTFDKAEYPNIMSGVRGMNFIEKTLESHQNGNIWVGLE